MEKTNSRNLQPKNKIDELEPPVDHASYDQEKYDAMNLIRTGIRTKDDLTKRIGQARLRVLEGRPLPEDLDLLEKK